MLVAFKLDVIALVLFGAFEYCPVLGQLIVHDLLIGVLGLGSTPINVCFDFIGMTAEVGPVLFILGHNVLAPVYVHPVLIPHD
jgi:hypothetical protein